jgi:hypothetical protein
MGMNAITLHLDKSTAWRGLHFERDGKRVNAEEALTEGFTITPNDAPAAATLLEQFIQARDEHQK